MTRLRPLALGSAVVLTLVGAAALAEESHLAVDAVTTRALLERAAFRACATLEEDPQIVGFLTESWKADLADTATALRQAGYAEDYVTGLVARLDIEAATPVFADRAALTAYCAVLGDWTTRFATFQFAIPQLEVKRILQQ